LRSKPKELEDAEKQRNNLRNNLNSIVSYCENCYECRRVQQMAYFGENFEAERCRNTCDNCWSGKTGSAEERDVTQEAEAYVNIVEHFYNLGVSKPINFFLKLFRGSQAKDVQGYQDVKGFGGGKHMKESDGERLYRLLVKQDILRETSTHNAGSVWGGTTTSLEVGRERHTLRLGFKMAFEVLPEKAQKRKKASEGKQAKSNQDSEGKAPAAKQRSAAHRLPGQPSICIDESDSDDGVCDLTGAGQGAAAGKAGGKARPQAHSCLSPDQQQALLDQLHALRDRIFENSKQTDSCVAALLRCPASLPCIAALRRCPDIMPCLSRCGRGYGVRHLAASHVCSLD
jgi:superfamily II DNA helicase RecQ